MKRAMIMTPSVRTRNILIITFKRATVEKSMRNILCIYYIDKSGAKHVSKNFFERTLYAVATATAAAQQHLTHTVFFLIFFFFVVVFLLCCCYVIYEFFGLVCPMLSRSLSHSMTSVKVHSH
jgi:hypothetical protein